MQNLEKSIAQIGLELGASQGIAAGFPFYEPDERLGPFDDVGGLPGDRFQDVSGTTGDIFASRITDCVEGSSPPAILTLATRLAQIGYETGCPEDVAVSSSDESSDHLGYCVDVGGDLFAPNMGVYKEQSVRPLNLKIEVAEPTKGPEGNLIPPPIKYGLYIKGYELPFLTKPLTQRDGFLNKPRRVQKVVAKKPGRADLDTNWRSRSKAAGRSDQDLNWRSSRVK